MKEISHTSRIFYFEDYHSIGNIEIIDLCTASINAMEDAYAIYSNYRVGAALLLSDGKLIKGGNQENAVYPLGLCAERVALFAAASQHPGKKILALAVATARILKNHEEIPPFPCGSCRQVILEMEQRQEQPIPLYVVGANHAVCKVDSVTDILPFAFDKTSL